MKTALHTFCTLTALFVVAGCAGVKSPHPLGAPVSDDLAKRFEGIWQFENQSVLHVKHVGNGEFKAAALEWEDDGFKIDEGNVLVTKDENVLYVNWVDPEATADEPKYVFARVAISADRSIVAFPVRGDVFSVAVSDGRLAGKVIKDGFSTEVHLEASKEDLDKFVERGKAAEQFQMDTPLVFKRIGSVN